MVGSHREWHRSASKRRQGCSHKVRVRRSQGYRSLHHNSKHNRHRRKAPVHHRQEPQLRKLVQERRTPELQANRKQVPVGHMLALVRRTRVRHTVLTECYYQQLVATSN